MHAEIQKQISLKVWDVVNVNLSYFGLIDIASDKKQPLQSCHKFTGENHEVVVKSARIQTYGIQIAHELLEPPLYSPCNHER